MKDERREGGCSCTEEQTCCGKGIFCKEKTPTDVTVHIAEIPGCVLVFTHGSGVSHSNSRSRSGSSSTCVNGCRRRRSLSSSRGCPVRFSIRMHAHLHTHVCTH
ncbi:hypothetical protein GDO81_024735 [Engystomops pustulosus]|uniref:Uncharacterized protein n=1 Tax=Engystomops pustulosus TaxID=76066 RepID=A0AAV6ZSR5_ENGPU|nr:hypothetical protein GDO81_024735 [Engystomops pustulosus]